MKIKYILLILHLNFCFAQNIGNLEQLPVNTLIGNINTNDSICLKEIERAKKDVNINFLKYTLTPIDINYDKRGTITILEKLLQKHQINIDFRGSYLAKQDVTLFCYSKYMSKIIEQRFGENFIKENIKKADSLYVIENPNIIFINGDVFDKNLFYPNAKSIKSQYDDCQNDFYKNLKLPKDFIKSNNNKFCIYSYAIFTVLKNKKITDISIETTFTNPSNEKQAAFIEKKLIQFIKKTKWIPKKKYGIDVNSKVVLAFFYK